MDRSDASALADLQMHWDEAYVIGLDGDIWLARFHGSADELRAHTSTELRELIRTDYAYRQRVRGVSAPAAGADLASTAHDDNDRGRGGEDGGARREDGGPGSGGGAGIPDLDDADVDDDDDDDYAAHFDHALGDCAGADRPHADRALTDRAQIATSQFDSRHIAGADIAEAGIDAGSAGSPAGRDPHDAEKGRRAGLRRAAEHSGYADLRGERMST